MKFQKGVLNDPEPKPVAPEPIRGPADIPGSKRTGELGHLFETHSSVSGSWRKYLKVLGLVAVLVTAAAGLVFYWTLPRAGDAVRAPRGLEEAIREHFLVIEKRTSTDIKFYFCGNFYWARVQVEKRPDIKTNPLYQIGTYAAVAEGNAGQWTVTAEPVIAEQDEQPCHRGAVK